MANQSITHSGHGDRFWGERVIKLASCGGSERTRSKPRAASGPVTPRNRLPGVGDPTDTSSPEHSMWAPSVLRTACGPPVPTGNLHLDFSVTGDENTFKPRRQNSTDLDSGENMDKKRLECSRGADPETV